MAQRPDPELRKHALYLVDQRMRPSTTEVTAAVANELNLNKRTLRRWVREAGAFVPEANIGPATPAQLMTEDDAAAVWYRLDDQTARQLQDSANCFFLYSLWKRDCGVIEEATRATQDSEPCGGQDRQVLTMHWIAGIARRSRRSRWIKIFATALYIPAVVVVSSLAFLYYSEFPSLLGRLKGIDLDFVLIALPFLYFAVMFMYFNRKNPRRYYERFVFHCVKAAFECERLSQAAADEENSRRMAIQHVEHAARAFRIICSQARALRSRETQAIQRHLASAGYEAIQSREFQLEIGGAKDFRIVRTRMIEMLFLAARREWHRFGAVAWEGDEHHALIQRVRGGLAPGRSDVSLRVRENLVSLIGALVAAMATLLAAVIGSK